MVFNDDANNGPIAEDRAAQDAGRGVFSTRLSRDLRSEGQGPAQGELQVNHRRHLSISSTRRTPGKKMTTYVKVQHKENSM